MSDITRSESIKQLHRLKADIINGLSFVSKTKDKHKALESLDMAIASMEIDEAYDLEYEQPEFCKDCISREAVYYYISSHIHEIITESGTDKNAHTNAILRSLANGVKTMPSVLPKVTKNDLGVSSGLKNVSPIIDWNNCHTSEQLDSIATTKNDNQILEDIKGEILEQYFGDSREEYFDDNDSKEYIDGAIEAADYIIKMIDNHKV